MLDARSLGDGRHAWGYSQGIPVAMGAKWLILERSSLEKVGMTKWVCFKGLLLIKVVFRRLSAFLCLKLLLRNRVTKWGLCYLALLSCAIWVLFVWLLKAAVYKSVSYQQHCDVDLQLHALCRGWRGKAVLWNWSVFLFRLPWAIAA